jgi:prepilin-type N-terminal cleavage/methylation domain-containing protein
LGNRINHPSPSAGERQDGNERSFPRFFGAEKGFTLIELIAVLAIMGMMFFLSIPRLDNDLESGDMNRVSRWIMLNVKALKSKAAEKRQTMALDVELDVNAFRILDSKSAEQEEEGIAAPKYQLPPGISLVDVEYPGKGLVTAGKTPIYFYEKGYSDKALIHIRDKDGAVFSFLIEPFLPDVEMVEERVGF